MPNPNEIVSLKELYERLIVLETKLDLMDSNQLGSRRYFAKMVWLIIATVLADIVIHYLLFAFGD